MIFFKNKFILKDIKRSTRKKPERRVNINKAIKASVVRLLDEDNTNLGVVNINEAIKKAEEKGLDLVEVSRSDNSVVAKIIDSGRYQYEKNKLKKKWRDDDKDKGKKNREEVKKMQIRLGLAGNMLEVKAREVKEWKENHYKVQITILFGRGRERFVDKDIIETKMKEFLKASELSEEYIKDMKKGGRGYILVI